MVVNRGVKSACFYILSGIGKTPGSCISTTRTKPMVLVTKKPAKQQLYRAPRRGSVRKRTVEEALCDSGHFWV